MSKKGQGLSMNVIIIAAIALLILVILTVLVIRAGNQTAESGSCEAVPGGICVDEGDDCGDDYGLENDPFKSCPTDMKCCIPVDEQS